MTAQQAEPQLLALARRDRFSSIHRTVILCPPELLMPRSRVRKTCCSGIQQLTAGLQVTSPSAAHGALREPTGSKLRLAHLQDLMGP